MEIQGNILVIGETQEVGSNGFKKRLLVVKTEEQYPQSIPMDFVQDKTSLLDGYSVGDKVKVEINLRGNEYQGKYYLNAQGWRIEKISSEQPAAPEFEPAVENNANNVENDLPF